MTGFIQVADMECSSTVVTIGTYCWGGAFEPPEQSLAKRCEYGSLDPVDETQSPGPRSAAQLQTTDNYRPYDTNTRRNRAQQQVIQNHQHQHGQDESSEQIANQLAEHSVVENAAVSITRIMQVV